jgi:hypothetical protein
MNSIEDAIFPLIQNSGENVLHRCESNNQHLSVLLFLSNAERQKRKIPDTCRCRLHDIMDGIFQQLACNASNLHKTSGAALFFKRPRGDSGTLFSKQFFNVQACQLICRAIEKIRDSTAAGTTARLRVASC